jgi:transglutaminase-like putative cysteine protease
MSEHPNILDTFEDEFKEIKKPSPFKWILAAFLIFLMMAMVIPYYQVAVDPPPTNIPTIEEVSSITAYETVDSSDIRDYVIIDSEIKTVADRIATTSCDSNQKKCQARAMFGFVQKNFEYVSDPVSDEYYKTAKETIYNGGALDCDDSSILLATLLQSIGIPARFVFVPGHVYIEAWVNDKWYAMDGTCVGCNFGEIHWKYTDDRKIIVTL